MNEVERGSYVFVGKKAEDSAYYYDLVLSRGYDGDLNWLAWDAAHKFGSRLVEKGAVSFQHGVIHGEKAREAAEYFDAKWQEAFDSCPETGRRSTMRSFGRALLKETEEKFSVRITVKDPYYY